MRPSESHGIAGKGTRMKEIFVPLQENYVFPKQVIQKCYFEMRLVDPFTLGSADHRSPP